jgi:hypothetical protein
VWCIPGRIYVQRRQVVVCRARLKGVLKGVSQVGQWWVRGREP